MARSPAVPSSPRNDTPQRRDSSFSEKRIIVAATTRMTTSPLTTASDPASPNDGAPNSCSVWRLNRVNNARTPRSMPNSHTADIP